MKTDQEHTLRCSGATPPLNVLRHAFSDEAPFTAEWERAEKEMRRLNRRGSRATMDDLAAAHARHREACAVTPIQTIADAATVVALEHERLANEGNKSRVRADLLGRTATFLGELRQAGQCLDQVLAASPPLERMLRIGMQFAGLAPDQQDEAAEQMRAVMEEGRPSAQAEATSFIPSIGLTFRQAADRTADLLKRYASTRPSGDDPEGRDEWFEEAESLDSTIMSAPALTVGDLLVKLERITCPHFGASELSPDRQAMEQITREIAALVGAHAEVHSSAPDSFVKTIAAFEAEAPGMLSVPHSPTASMERAATATAGITPEQFRRAYAAALEALAQERAA